MPMAENEIKKPRRKPTKGIRRPHKCCKFILFLSFNILIFLRYSRLMHINRRVNAVLLHLHLSMYGCGFRNVHLMHVSNDLIDCSIDSG